MDKQTKLSLEKDFAPKGPIFEIKPGWGGRLKKWIKNNYKRFLTGILIGLIIATGIVLAIKQGRTPVKTQTATMITQVVAKGDSQTLIARKALAEYLSEFSNTSLTSGQKVFIEELLQKEIKGKLVEGTKIEFKIEDIENLIEQSFNLLPSTLEKWEMYAKNVRF